MGREHLEFFKKGRKTDDFFKEFGYKTGLEKFGELIEERFVEKIEGNYILTEMGKTQLTRLKERDTKNFIQPSTITYHGDGGNIVGTALNSGITQTSSVKKVTVPKGISSGWNPLIEWIFKRIGEKNSSIVSGLLSLLLGGFYSYLGIKKGFLPEITGSTLFPKGYLLRSIVLAFTILMIILFFSIKFYKKRKKCPECNRYLNYFEVKDGEVLEKSPHNHLKIKRFFKCPCGYEYSRTKWENPPENKK